MRTRMTLLILFILLAGCQTDELTNPVAPTEFDVNLGSLPDTLDGVVAQRLSLPVTANVRQSDGSPGAGVRVEFTLHSGAGLFDPAAAVTDKDGKAATLVRLTPVEGLHPVRLAAIVPGGSASAELVLRGLKAPAVVTLIAARTDVLVRLGRPIELTLNAFFTDSAGVAVPDLPVAATLYRADGPTFGSLSFPSRTDDHGGLPILFNTLGGTGSETVIVSTVLPQWGAEQVADSVTIRVRLVIDALSSLTVRGLPFPSNGEVAPDSLFQLAIRVQARDSNSVGLEGVPLEFEATLGVIPRHAVTDSTGIAGVIYNNDYLFGVAEITITVPGTKFESRAIITIHKRADRPGSLDLTTDRSFIYADNGRTHANITAVSKDVDDQALVGKELQFSCTRGAINSPVVTDSLGVARAIFTSAGIPPFDPGEIIPATIYVRWREQNLVDSVEVTIRPRTTVARVILVSSQSEMLPGGRDTCSVRATCFLASGGFAPEGAVVHFAVDGNNGRFVQGDVPVGMLGVAETRYVSGNFAGTAVLRAFARNDLPDGQDSVTYSNEVQISLRPGPPAALRLTANPTELNINDPDGRSVITAGVTDAAGNPVSPGTRVLFSATLGDIVPSAVTDSLGRATALLTPGDEAGVAVVSAGVSELEAQVEVTFRGRVPVDRITLIAAQSQMQARGRDSCLVRATCFLTNDDYAPRETIVIFSVFGDMGRFSPDTVVVGNLGVAESYYIPGEHPGTAVLRAFVRNEGAEGGIVYSNEVTIALLPGPPAALRLTANPTELNINDPDARSVITAGVTDAAGNPVSAGTLVRFTTTKGNITPPSAVTDSLGRATALLTPGDEAGVAVVSAGVSELEAQVEVTFRGRVPVDRITLIVERSWLRAGGRDSLAIRVTCFLATDDFAPRGTIVHFSVLGDMGRFSQDTVAVGDFGRAESYFISGERSGTALLRAFVRNEGEDSIVYSNEVHITLLPGPPANIRLTADPSELEIGDPYAFSNIIATVTDAAGYPVEQGTLVRFTTSLGNITPLAVTDTLGRAIARLTAEGETGEAVITARVETGNGILEAEVRVDFIGGQLSSLRIEFERMTLRVPGNGDESQTRIFVYPIDRAGNPFLPPLTVVFQLLNAPRPPEGSHFEGDRDWDSVRTENGVGVTTLYAGTQIGGLTLRVYSWRDVERHDTVQVTLPSVVVIAGPPLLLDVDVNDDGDDAGGGMWQIVVAAKVWDSYNNPVADRIPVVFTVGQGDHASIEAGYTGNDIGDGPRPGVAFTWLRYHSLNTFEPVTITANVQGVDGLIRAERLIMLPLQDGALELNVDPQNWMFDRQRPNDTCSIRVWAVLTDGHQIFISNGPILFRTDRARLYNEPGTTTAYLRGTMNDFFLDDFTVEVTVHIEASVQGYDVADTAFIFITRR